MIKEILDGITAALHAAYETYDIYADQNIEQGLTEPCFFIESVDAPSTDVVKGWNERTYSFDVMFFPEDETDRATMYDVGDALHLILRRITVDDDGESRTVSAADGATYRIVDGVLHYTVAYDLHLVYEYGGDVMTDLIFEDNDDKENEESDPFDPGDDDEDDDPGGGESLQP
ncbi:MAG: hypothetical protein J6U98_09380 [Abditibacteriota bacterium]|nr:hypothetical protein [Abditibacteriota bacterium]